jgi:hypothetical protein
LIQDSWFSPSCSGKNILFTDGCRLAPPQLFRGGAFVVQGSGWQPLLIWSNNVIFAFKNLALALGLGWQGYGGEPFAGVDQDFMGVDMPFHELCRSEGHFEFVELPGHDLEAAIFLALKNIMDRIFLSPCGLISHSER